MKAAPSTTPAAPRSSSSLLCIREYEEDPSINTGSTAFREFIIRTHDGSSSCTSKDERATSSIFHSITAQAVGRWLRAPISVAKDLFLPLGYPASVRKGYFEYQVYDSLQGLCSYLRAVLCSAQVLQAAGVGNEQATALAAALAWAQKDGAAMLGGLLFSYWASPQFDGHVKEFRLFADVINDVAMTLDMWTPYFCSVGMDIGSGSYSTRRLLFISSLSSLGKTMCGMSAGATKSSITQYFAVQGNMADLNAREATQETFMSLLGMVLGSILASQFLPQSDAPQTTTSSSNSNNMTMQWTIFTLLTLIHIWANYQGVALLRLLTLNRERTEVILKSIIQHEQQSKSALDDSINDHQSSSNSSRRRRRRREQQEIAWIRQHGIPKPSQVFESMWASTCKMLWPGRHFQLNTHGLTDLFALDATTVLDQLRMVVDHDDHSSCTSINADRRHVLVLVGSGPYKCRQILVCLLAGANNQDELRAFCHAFYLRHVLLTRRNDNNLITTTTNNTATSDITAQNRALVQEAAMAIQPWFETINHDVNSDVNDDKDDSADTSSSSNICNPSHYGILMRALVRQGWDVHGRMYLGFSRRRSQWARTKEE